MTNQDPFRAPQIGDTIRNLETGSTVLLETASAVKLARVLVLCRTWCVEPKGGGE